MDKNCQRSSSVPADGAGVGLTEGDPLIACVIRAFRQDEDTCQRGDTN